MQSSNYVTFNDTPGDIQQYSPIKTNYEISHNRVMPSICNRNDCHGNSLPLD